MAWPKPLFTHKSKAADFKMEICCNMKYFLSKSNVYPTLTQMNKATFPYFDTIMGQEVEDIIKQEEVLETPVETPEEYIKAIWRALVTRIPLSNRRLDWITKHLARDTSKEGGVSRESLVDLAEAYKEEFEGAELGSMQTESLIILAMMKKVAQEKKLDQQI